MLADTSFLVDLFDGDERANQKLRALRDEDTTVLLPAGVIFELYTSAGGREEETLEKLRKKMPRIGLTVESEKEAARIREEQLESGKPVKSVDYLIAGIARKLDQPVLTSDQHFEEIEGVEVENYR